MNQSAKRKSPLYSYDGKELKIIECSNCQSLISATKAVVEALKEIEQEEMVSSGLVNLVRVKQIARKALANLPEEFK